MQGLEESLVGSSAEVPDYLFDDGADNAYVVLAMIDQREHKRLAGRFAFIPERVDVFVSVEN